MERSINNIIKIGKDDYITLVSTGSITKGGVTYTYDPSALYLVKSSSSVKLINLL